MKIVGYVHPGCISLGPLWNYGWLETARLLQTLRRDAGCDCTLIVGSRFLQEAKREGTTERLRDLRVVEIDEVALFKQTNALGVTPTAFDKLVYAEERAGHPALRMLAEEIVRKFGPGEPDVLISPATPTRFLAEPWSRTFRLHTESLFSRNPFTSNLFFDHLGTYGGSIIGRAGDRLRGYQATDAARTLLDAFRARVAAGLDATDPFRSTDIRRGFDRVCLLPLQVSNWYGFDEQAAYRTQFEFLFDVLSAAPRDVGMIVTEHIGAGVVLKDWGSDRNFDYLRATFPNMIFVPQSRSFNTSSQFFVPRVDGVWTVSSGLGFQALLFARMLGSPASSYIASVAHATDAASFFANVGRAAPESRDGFMAWLLERYLVPESLANDGRWLLDYFLRRLAAARAAHDPIDAFVPVADAETLMDAWVARAPQPVLVPFYSHDWVEGVRAELNELYRSKSIRLTAPFRAVARFARKLRPSTTH